MTQVACDGLIVKIDGIHVEDANLVRLLESSQSDQWAETIERALGVGARGLLTMGLNLDVASFRNEIGREVTSLLDAANSSIAEMLRAAEEAMAERLDPEQRSSVVGRTLAELELHRNALFSGLDINLVDSHAAKLLKSLEAMIGEGGEVEQRLLSVMQGEAAGIPSLADSIATGFAELRDLMNQEKGRQAEAARGTRKGFDFEDVVDGVLCAQAAALGGCAVERVGAIPGSLSANALVGDFTLTLSDGTRIVIEAKNVSRIGLTGKEGILTELDRALANRSADYAICVSAQDSFPREVGAFNVYKNRVLVVDDGEGTMLGAAIRWIAAHARAVSSDSQITRERLIAATETLKRTSQRFSGLKKSLAEMQRSLGSARDSVDELRNEIVEATDLVAGAAPPT